MLWDRGTWQPDIADVDASLQKGEVKFTIHGKKLKGSWVLVRTRGFGKSPLRSSWLLIKHSDQYASAKDVTVVLPRSVESKRLLADIAKDNGGDVERASRAIRLVRGGGQRPPSRVKGKTALVRGNNGEINRNGVAS